MTSLPKNAEMLDRAVADLSHATAALLRRLRAESDPDELGWSQIFVAARLAREGPSTTADLARAELMKPQSMGAILALMERNGLVERRPHPTDGRQILFALTAEGEAARQRRTMIKREWFTAAMGKLSLSEQQILIDASVLIRRLADS